MTVTANVTWGKHLFTRLDSGLTLHTRLRMDGTWTVLRGDRGAGRMTGPGRDTVRVLLATAGTTVAGERIPVVELIRTAAAARAVAVVLVDAAIAGSGTITGSGTVAA